MPDELVEPVAQRTAAILAELLPNRPELGGDISGTGWARTVPVARDEPHRALPFLANWTPW